jgi:hypothetical protein
MFIRIADHGHEPLPLTMALIVAVSNNQPERHRTPQSCCCSMHVAVSAVRLFWLIVVLMQQWRVPVDAGAVDHGAPCHRSIQEV